MFKLIRTTLVTGLMLAWALPLTAQSPLHQFKYQVTPYFWMSGMEGRVGVLGRSAEIDESFGDIWDNLKFGAMGTFEAKGTRWVFLADAMYLNLVNEQSTPDLDIITSAEVKAKTLILDPEFGYPIVRRDGTELNGMAGVRFWHLKNEIRFDSASGTLGVTETKSWVDPIVGLQFRHNFGRVVYVTAKGDIGGFSTAARLDWQAFGGLGFRFDDRVSIIVGYRNLSVDYTDEGFVHDTDMKGILVGIGIRF